MEDSEVEESLIQEVISELPEELLQKYGFKAFERKLKATTGNGDILENIKVCKSLISSFLLSAEPSEVDEAFIMMESRFSLLSKHTKMLTKFYKEEKRRADNRQRQLEGSSAGNYDMDSTSGRAKIIRDFADVYMEKQRDEGRPLKCVNGKLRMYKAGIYPESEELMPFLRRELVDIGLINGVNITPQLIDATVRHIETACAVMAENCEPEKEYVVVLNNGIMDTRYWSFSPFDPDKVYFSKIPVDFNPDAPRPEIFMNLIDSCFLGNENQIELLQEAFGYCLTKSYKYQDVFYLLGDGGNGKGSVTGVLRMLLGSENVTSFSLYQLTDGEHIDYNIAMMLGKHANICGDVSSKKIVNTENLKKLSSNTDLVTGRHVREKPFQFINYAKMFFLMNRAPESDAHTTGDKRRIRVINFINSFSEKKEEIKDIHQVIYDAGELPGVLNWAIEGLKRLEANKGFTDARTIAQRAIEYDKKANTMRHFVEDRLFEDPGSIVPNEMVYDAYNNYRKKVGGAELGEKELKNRLLYECREAGWVGITNIQKRATQLPSGMKEFVENILGKKSARCFYGLGLVTEEPQTEIPDFCKEPEVEVIETDADMYEAMMKEMNERDGSSEAVP